MTPAHLWAAPLVVVAGLAAAPVAVAGQHDVRGVSAEIGAPAGGNATCEPSITRPGIGTGGRVRPGGPRLLGEGPVLAGPFRGPRAVLHVSGGPGRFGSKLYYLIDPAGPASATVIVRRLDRSGRGRFEVHRTDRDGRAVRALVPLLRLDIGRTRRENPPRRGDRWLGQPGSVLLPALGCYEVRVRWPGGGWSRTFSVRPDPRFGRSPAGRLQG